MPVDFILFSTDIDWIHGSFLLYLKHLSEWFIGIAGLEWQIWVVCIFWRRLFPFPQHSAARHRRREFDWRQNTFETIALFGFCFCRQRRGPWWFWWSICVLRGSSWLWTFSVAFAGSTCSLKLPSSRGWWTNIFQRTSQSGRDTPHRSISVASP